MKELKDEADELISKAAALRFVQSWGLPCLTTAAIGDLSRGRGVEQAEAVQQGALPDPTEADDGHHLRLVNVEIEMA